MDACEVVIVGGGPAGSACAWKLRNAGLDVAIVDKAAFPRDKVCAGWITPQIVDDLKLDLDQYRAGRTFQPITGFRVGVIGQARTTEIRYARPVSYGIRRCEFDHYLLQRSGARLLLGAPVSSIRRDRGGWVVGGSIRASMLVGAGGHFCPVGRLLNGPPDRAVVVAARETEFRIDPRDAEAFAIGAESAELYFCRDLGGYGWCFRKQDFLNIGFGRVDARALPKETDQFAAFLAAMRRVPPSVAWQWRGDGSSMTAWCWSAIRRGSRIPRAAKAFGRRSNPACSPPPRSSTATGTTNESASGLTPAGSGSDSALRRSGDRRPASSLVPRHARSHGDCSALRGSCGT